MMVVQAHPQTLQYFHKASNLIQSIAILVAEYL